MQFVKVLIKVNTTGDRERSGILSVYFHWLLVAITCCLQSCYITKHKGSLQEGNQWSFFNNRIRKESYVSLSTYILIHTPYRVLTHFKYEHSSTAVPNVTKKKFKTFYVYSSKPFMCTGAFFLCVLPYQQYALICVHVCVHMYRYVCVCARACTHMHACIQLWVHTWSHAYVVCVHMHACVCVCVCLSWWHMHKCDLHAHVRVRACVWYRLAAHAGMDVLNVGKWAIAEHQRLVWLIQTASATWPIKLVLKLDALFIIWTFCRCNFQKMTSAVGLLTSLVSNLQHVYYIAWKTLC